MIPTLAPPDAILTRLEAVKPLPSGGWIARCPGHEDRSPSLKVDVDRTGKVLLHCYAGCEPSRIVEALGMTLGDLFPPESKLLPPTNGAREYRWEIRDEGGAAVATHVRRETPDGKRFSWQRPNGEWGLGGIKTAELPLYGVHEVGDATLIVVTEGEKSRDAVARCGLSAVGSVTGASSTPGASALRPLIGRTVVLWPDQDGPGESHMTKIAANLVALGQVKDKIRRVRWDGAPPHGDAADFSGTADEIRTLVSGAGPWWSEAAPIVVRRTQWTATELLAADLPEPNWAVPDLIPEGLTVLAGRPKKGKSRLALDVALTVASGLPALGHFEVDQGGAVLFAGLEDGPRRLQERLQDMLGKRPPPPTLDLWIDLPKLGDGGEEAIERWIATHPNARLIVIDTYQRVRKPTTGREGNPYALDYTEAARLQTIAIGARLAVLLIMHTRKPVGGLDPFDDVLGSTGNTAAADALMLLQTETGKADAKLLVTGRDIEQAEHALASDGISGRWKRIGQASDVRRSAQREAILAALRVAGPEGLRPVELSQATKQRSGNVRYLLMRMKNDGEIAERGGAYICTEPRFAPNAPNDNNALTLTVPQQAETPHGTTLNGTSQTVRALGALRDDRSEIVSGVRGVSGVRPVGDVSGVSALSPWTCWCGGEVKGHLAHCTYCGAARADQAPDDP